MLENIQIRLQNDILENIQIGLQHDMSSQYVVALADFYIYFIGKY